MTRQEYLSELDSHLITLPDEERELAVNFYTEYFDEAGVENEKDVMDELGKPFALAKSIISEQSAYSKSEVYIKYRESNPIDSDGVYVSMKKESTPYNPVTYTSVASVSDDVKAQIDAGSIEQDVMPSSKIEQETEQETKNNYHIKFDKVEPKTIDEEIYQSSNNEPNNETQYNYQKNNAEYNYQKKPEYDYSYQDESPLKDKKQSNGPTGLKIALFILFIIFVFCPIILPIICVIVAVMICFVATLVCSIILFVISIISIVPNGIKSIGLIAISLLLAGISMLLIVPCLLFFSKTLPWFFKGMANFIKNW